MIILTIIENNTIPPSSINFYYSDIEFETCIRDIKNFKERLEHPGFEIEFIINFEE